MSSELLSLSMSPAAARRFIEALSYAEGLVHDRAEERMMRSGTTARHARIVKHAEWLRWGIGRTYALLPPEDTPESTPADLARQLARQLVKRDREIERLRGALAYLADPESWAGNPHDQTSTLYGHFTPYELARRALGMSDD